MADDMRTPGDKESHGKDINEILAFAARETETKLAYERPHTAEDTSARQAEEEDAAIEKERDDETADDALRADREEFELSIAERLNSDEEFASYLAGEKKRMDNPKVSEIYNLINSQGAALRFTEPDDSMRPHNYEQAELFDTGDLDAVAPATEAVQTQDEAAAKTTVFDADYDSLSRRIESGELSMFQDDYDEGQVKLGLADTRQIDMPAGNGDISAADAKLRIAFGLIDKEDEKVPEEVKQFDEQDIYDAVRVRKKKSRKKREAHGAAPEYEYTSPEQDDEVVSMLEKSIRKNRIKLLLSVVIAVAVLLVEYGDGSALLPELIHPGRYGLLYILVDMQLLLFSAAVMIENIVNGVKSMLRLSPTPDTVLFFTVLVPTVHCIVTAFLAANDKDIELYCFVGAAAAVVGAISRLSQSKRDLRCFDVISANGEKFTASRLSASAKEANEFYKYLLKDSDLYTVKKARFTEGFFERLCRRPKSDELIGFQLPLIGLAAVIAGAVAYALGSDVYGALSAAVTLFAVSLPLSAFFVSVMPVNAANMIARNRKSALIGNAVADEYDNAGVLSFSDSEVFPAKNIKVTGFRTYGDFRIDKVIISVARIFRRLGGPLSEVLMNAVEGEDEDVGIFRLIEVGADGIVASMDGRDYYIGKRAFMRKNRFELRHDPSDEEFESNCGSVMYVAVDDDIAAKIYIKYKASASFNKLLREMYSAGICVGIKTLDPNIDNALLQRTVTYTKCPIAILKAETSDEILGTADRVSSGIVTSAGLHTFLQMFVLTDKTRHCIRTNAIINFISVFLSFAIVFFLIATNSLGSMNSVFAMLFQLLWLLPVTAVSFLI